MKFLPNTDAPIARVFRSLLLISMVSIAGCSTMQATDASFLKNRVDMTTTKDGSIAYFRSQTRVDPHQVRSLSVEWAIPKGTEFSDDEKARLVAALRTAISRETEALPKVSGGRPVTIRAVITRVESVSPALNVVTAVLLTVPLDRGGAAVEIEVLDAETQQPLASLAHANFAPMSEFRAKFSKFAPAEFALDKAAVELAKLLRPL